ncbi:hypothetical protein LINPERPRIM_LOCUS7718, partial [Linum perenne]
ATLILSSHFLSSLLFPSHLPSQEHTSNLLLTSLRRRQHRAIVVPPTPGHRRAATAVIPAAVSSICRSIAKPPCLPFAGERRRRYMQWFRRPSAAGPAAVSSSDEAVDPLQPLSSPLGRRSPPDLLSPAPGRGLFLKYSSCFLGSPTLQKCTASLGVCWIQTPKAM